MTFKIRSRSPNFELHLALSKDYIPVQYHSPSLKTSWVIVQKPQEFYNLSVTLKTGSRSPIFKINLALTENHKAVQYKSSSSKVYVIMQKAWNHIQKSGSVTFKMRSRSSIFKLRLAPNMDYNPVQYKSPSSKTSSVIVRKPKLTQVPLWPWKVGQGHPSSNFA